MKAGILRPRSPERVCWGCDKFCAADDLACGGGTIRTPHPIEMFGEEWADRQEAEDESLATGSLPPEGPHERKGQTHRI